MAASWYGIYTLRLLAGRLQEEGVKCVIWRNATKILAELVADQSPVLITQHGIPTAYLVDVATFEALQSRLRLLEGIARGERAIQEGRTSTHVQAKRRLRRWLE